ncbi:MAG: hypothetical protein JF887_14070 [Candidatus Dormibacteraeota bacterium]|uniref:Uncharacterized protein n=1 Tax=Candidatus Amunia macphersoniae TaxID=3127014 RepID=A0A934KQB4_9BACT|nr:hypothetical protein [Candidatus Dormibacteraeota bacterium]
MGWLRNYRGALDQFGLRDPHFERDAAAWTQWASEHGWTYQAEAPELVGRYKPVYRFGAEVCRHLLTTQLHGLHTIAFEHRRYAHGGNSGEGINSLVAVIVLQLPGLPPEEFVKMGAAKTVRKLGGSVPHNYDLDLVGDELVARRASRLDSKWLQTDAELLALQIAAVPGSFWRPVSERLTTP